MLPKKRNIHTRNFIGRQRMRLIAVILTLSTSLLAQAADRVFESGPQQVRVLELFTSEGCSSCPPAEAWLSKLKAEPGLWKEFVPLAFHVDYWDRLGWRDPFAAKEWTARQYQYSNGWKSESVYTPAFVLDGREWSGRSIPAPSNDKPGVLKLSISNQKLIAEFLANAVTDVDLHIATLG